MTATGEGHYFIGRKQQQVFPAALDYDGPHYFSQRLVDAAHANNIQLALELLNHPSVDVNFIGTVSLKSRKTEVELNGESASEVRVDFEEFKTDVTALFLAAHNGNVSLVRKLLNLGANVKQKLFRGYATTAAVREGHMEVLELLLNGGAGRDPAACEEALLVACYLGLSRPAELLMASDMKNMIRPHVAVHALVTASSRGFVDFVHTLVKSGVDANANARILLQSSKPSLHANVDCNALVAAIVNRQACVIKLLLKVGCRTDTEVRVGAWSWDATTGEEFRVGAGLAEPYRVTWCAVEYFEASGTILRMLLGHLSPNIPHLGRTILHHAIVCRNARAVEVLLNCGSDMEFPTETTKQMPIHLAARFGLPIILCLLINAGCDLNSRTGSGETALMICARHKHGECLKLVASASADFGLTYMSGQCAMQIVDRMALGFEHAVLDVIRSGKIVQSSDNKTFSSLALSTRANDVKALKEVMKLQPDLAINLNEKDDESSAVRIAAAGGHVEALRLLLDDAGIEETRAVNSLGEASYKNRDEIAKILAEHAEGHANKNNNSSRSASAGSVPNPGSRAGVDLVDKLVKEDGYGVIDNGDGYATISTSTTPLLLAAAADGYNMSSSEHSHSSVMVALDLDLEVDEKARRVVRRGAHVKKHTKAGKGCPHEKVIKMVEGREVLSWGKSRRRNVVCRGAEVGPSSEFRWNRRSRSACDADEAGVFRVVTTENKEIHFCCLQGGREMASLWVRGIRLLTREAIFGTLN